jgi:hypothetical protein
MCQTFASKIVSQVYTDIEVTEVFIPACLIALLILRLTRTDSSHEDRLRLHSTLVPQMTSGREYPESASITIAKRVFRHTGTLKLYCTVTHQF